MDSSPTGLPSADHPDLVLAESTPTELNHVWGLHHPIWGPALKIEDYLAREQFLMRVPLAKNGGITHWILTDRKSRPDNRPIYASCESLRKRALASITGPDGPVLQDGIAHGIASVFTNPKYRGHGYASRMMKELGPKLTEWSEGRNESREHGSSKHPIIARSLFSILYSDIGKTFYAKTGWVAFDSSHLCFRPAPGRVDGQPSKARPLGYHDLPILCHLDEKLLRETMQKRAKGLPSNGKEVCAALIPELDQFLWHLMREDFMTKHIFGKTPTVRGALFGEPGKRIWAVWTRGYYGSLEKIEDNTFHILRFVVEDETCPEDYVVEGFREIIQLAQAEASQWRASEVQMWNPSLILKNAAAKSGIEHEMVEREEESIASLMWYGSEATENVDWVANEKFAWY